VASVAKAMDCSDTHVKENDRLVSTKEKILEVVDKDMLPKEELKDFVGYYLVKHISTYDVPTVYSRRKGIDLDLTMQK
jgi:hemerythrin